jgi:predicted DNA-binding transcriptional regulator YafY
VIIEIIYQGKDHSFSKRKIIVKGINENYIKAFCLTRKQTRIFRIESILAVASVKGKREERHYA